MTVFYREESRRCDRCKRMSQATRRVTVRWDGRAQAQQMLCGRCRSQLADTLDGFMRDEAAVA